MFQGNVSEAAVSEIIKNDFGGLCVVNISALHDAASLCSYGIENLYGFFILFKSNAIPVYKRVRIISDEVFEQIENQLINVYDLVIYGTDKCKIQSDYFAFKFRPGYTRSIQKLELFVYIDPLVSSGDTRFVSGFGHGFSHIGIDKGGLSDIWNSQYHGTDGRCFDALFQIFLHNGLAGFVYQAVKLFEGGFISGIYFKGIKSFF